MHAQLTLPASDAPTVLIVEDDPALRDLLREALTEEYPDVRIHSASTGQQALALTAQARPHLLLLDYHLATSMTGIEVYDRMHTCGESLIPTIMLSADAPLEELDARHIRNLGKPFDLEMLLERVGRELSPAD